MPRFSLSDDELSMLVGVLGVVDVDHGLCRSHGFDRVKLRRLLRRLSGVPDPELIAAVARGRVH